MKSWVQDEIERGPFWTMEYLMLFLEEVLHDSQQMMRP